MRIDVAEGEGGPVWRLVTSTYFDFEMIESQRAADRLPEHLVPLIAADLGADIHQPRSLEERGRPALVDRLGALIYGEPQHWETARRLRRVLERDDRVLASGCDAGVPVALVAIATGRRRMPLAFTMIDPTRTRSRIVSRFLALLMTRLVIFVPAAQQVEALRAGVGRRLVDVAVLGAQTDPAFFRPADPPAAQPVRPLVVGCGAEQRDYALLAEATANLDLDVRVCLASPNLSASTRYTMPSVPPDNFHVDYYSFAELRSLYQRSQMVVVPLLDNPYSAGLTTILEAVACGRPVVTTRSVGVINELIDGDLIIGVEPGDEDGLRAAIADVLARPEPARERAGRAHQHLIENLSSDRYRQNLRQALTALDPALAAAPDQPGRRSRSLGSS